jgi:Uma2 family endonuclease
MPTAPALEPALSRETVDQSDGPLYEVVDGQRVGLPPMSAYAVAIANELLKYLILYLHDHDTGRALGEMLFSLPVTPPQNRRPDVAYVSYQRAPRSRPIPEQQTAWDVVPELAVEVLSPTDRADELMDRLHSYFQAGVQLVWVVYPRHQLVYVHESVTALRGLTAADELTGGPVLPHFRLPLSSLFPPTATVDSTTS